MKKIWGLGAMGMIGWACAESVPLAVPKEVALNFPGEVNLALEAQPAHWLESRMFRMTLVMPEGIPAYTGSLVWFKDRDDYWHQYVMPGFLKPGTNSIAVPLDAEASGWQVPGHSLSWHYRVRLNPQSVGFRIFADNAFTGRCAIVSATLEVASDPTPPVISQVVPLTLQPHVLSLYELKFRLPDRYANPFDPTQIDAGARIVGPDGSTNLIHAFYYQAHYRVEDELGQPVEPDGAPEWRIRYCPRMPGEYRVSLYAKDLHGEAVCDSAATFHARPAAQDALHFVRVSQKDRRYFEFDDGTPFYPIGHNLRSATDDRMDDKFPWRFRKPEETTAYRRYFARMQAAGENMAEVWMSAWSLGIEWTEGIGGYHGANDYQMGNAWELDQVLGLAQKHRIYINLVLNYHGQIGTCFDAEWHLHPYNAQTPGGWLKMPLDFFSDARAVEMKRRYCRYTQARWGWVPNLLGYELCSEINLTGHEGHHKTHFDPRVVEWCRVLASYFKSIDPYRHLVSVHVSNDYKYWNPELCKMDVLDFNPLDAYHHVQPERIIRLLAETAEAGKVYDKPVLVTEFGGSPMAAGLEHLKLEQHAALWSATSIPLAGIPMFWWWQVVDENDLYGQYTPIRKFMTGVDPRDPVMQQALITVHAQAEGKETESPDFDAVCLASPDRARGYVYPKRFARVGKDVPEGMHLALSMGGFSEGIFRIEFFETQTAQVTRRFDVRSQAGQLVLPVPAFKNDCAFKLSRITALGK